MPEGPQLDPPLDEGSDSDGSDNGTDEANMCIVCCRRKEVVEFQGCSHKLCQCCTKRIWWTRMQYRTHLPSFFPCPMCRNEVREVKIEGLEWIEWLEWIGSVSKKAAARIAEQREGNTI